ncbi:MAG: sialate O-acetylesterase, partial [Bacteroidota bacterium]|nr:sialate O-acetylesterase [Bacteroidota bacterium]
STWSVSLQKQKANTTPQSLVVTSGSESLELKNILIGDVWLLSGQSNMEWPMSRELHWKEEQKNTYQPLIRINNPPPAGRFVYAVAYTDSLNKRLTTTDFYQWGSWQVSDSNTIKGMSAIGYYFAKSLVESEHIPIGLINLSIGGAPLETFVSREALQRSKQFAAKVKGDWLSNSALPEWIRERGAQNVGGNGSGYRDELGLNHAYKPGFAYESGVKPLLPFPIKGVLWYQGESNSLEKERVVEYGDLLHVLIDDYREGWKQPAMPFYWVQLSSIDTANYKSHYWPQFRDEQRKLLAVIKNGGMAVSSDIGFKNDVHPTNKKAVGERLARWALNQLYGKEIVPSGPLPVAAIYRDGKLFVSFQYAKSLQTADGRALRGFSLDGVTEVEATIERNSVVISSGQKPAFVYYGWKPFSDANLVNEANLPTSTFKLNVTTQ